MQAGVDPEASKAVDSETSNSYSERPANPRASRMNKVDRHDDKTLILHELSWAPAVASVRAAARPTADWNHAVQL